MKTTTLIKLIKAATKGSDKAALPILETLLIKDGTITASDLEVFVTIKGIPRLDVRCCVNAVDFINAIDTPNEVSAQLDKGGNIVLTSEGERIKLDTMNTEDFPKVPKTDFKPIGEIEKGDHAVIEVAANYVGHDKFRPQLSCVYVRDQIVATDAHVMYFKDKKKALSGDVLLPAKILSILKLMPDAYSVKQGGNYTTLENEVLTITWKQGERFPDYKAVIPAPEAMKISLQFDTKEMSAAVERAIKFANKQTNQVILDLNGKTVLSAADLYFNKEFSKEIGAVHTGEEIRIGLNGMLLNGVLDGCGKKVVMKLSTPSGPAVLNGEFLLMPIMI